MSSVGRKRGEGRAGHLASWSGFGDFGQDLAFFPGYAAEMVLREAIAQVLESFFWRIDHLKQFQVVGRDGAGVDHGLKIDKIFPVLAPVNDNENLLCKLIGLGEGKDFEKLVECAEPSGKNYQCLGQVSEPELSHEEVMELEIQRRGDEGIGILFERQVDVEPDGLAASFFSAAVGRFHDAGASSGGNHEAAAAGGNFYGPLRQHESELAGVLVVAGHFHRGLGTLEVGGGVALAPGRTEFSELGAGILVGMKTRRAEEDHRVLNLLATETGEGFAVFRQDSENAAVGAAEERLILVGERSGFEAIISHARQFPRRIS